MRLDDLKTWILATFGAYCTAASLTALTDPQIELREMPEPGLYEIQMFLHPEPEPERIPFSTLSDLVRERIEVYFFAARNGTEDALRTRADAYAAAFVDCIRTHEDFMELGGPEHFDGVEGKPSIKATKLTVVLEYED